MAVIKGGVKVAGFISPTSTEDTYPATDPKYQLGGFREVSSKSEMEAIPEPRRRDGMIVAVVSADPDIPTQYYEYRDGKFTIKDFGSDIDLSQYYRKEETYTQEEVEEKIKEAVGGIDTDPVGVDNTTIKYNDDNELTANIATNNTAGVVKVDNETTFVDKGVLKVNVKTGDGTTIIPTEDGKLKISDELVQQLADLQKKLNDIIDGDAPQEVNIPIATAFTLGIVRPDNVTITVNSKGVMSASLEVNVASKVNKGIVQADEKTLTVDNGIISLIEKIDRILDLKDVKIPTLKGKKDYVLTVGESEDHFELRLPGAPIGRYKEVEINSVSRYELAYDFNPHYNIAANAMLKVEVLGSDPADVKYVSKSGSEFLEVVELRTQRLLPMNELDMSVYVRGHAKVMVSIASFK